MTIEKILVDLVSNKYLKNILSKEEVSNIYNECLRKYKVNESKLIRYAKRRNAHMEVSELLKETDNNN